MKPLVRIHRESLMTLILELRGLIRKTLVLEVLALVIWKMVLAPSFLQLKFGCLPHLGL